MPWTRSPGFPNRVLSRIVHGIRLKEHLRAVQHGGMSLAGVRYRLQAAHFTTKCGKALQKSCQAQPLTYSTTSGLYSGNRWRNATSSANSTEHSTNKLPVTWVESMPPSTRPYLYLVRADKPIGTWLLLWPCCWSIAIAAPAGNLPNFALMGIFAAGAVVMRGAGCTINDMWDRDFDKKVERTKSRPIASGVISRERALVFLGGQLTVGLGVLVSLNLYSIALGATSMVLVILYPLMKRYTYWPQFVLGLTFNWGALLGASAVLGYCPWATCLPMYVGSVAWTIVYDTIYAHQDKSDDIKVGVKSTALLFAQQTKPILSGFSVIFIGSLAHVGTVAGLGPLYFASVGAAAAHLGWQIFTVDLDSPHDCMSKFKSNTWVGGIIACGIIISKLLE